MTKPNRDAVGEDIERMAALAEGLYIDVQDGRASLSSDLRTVLREAGRRCLAAAEPDRSEQVNAGLRRLRDTLSEVGIMARYGLALEPHQVTEMQRVAQHAVAIAGLPADDEDGFEDPEEETVN